MESEISDSKPSVPADAAENLQEETTSQSSDEMPATSVVVPAEPAAPALPHASSNAALGSITGTGGEPMLVHWQNLCYTVDVVDPKTKEPRKKVILRNISAYAKPGEMLAVMGSSGAGKSSLFNAIAGRLQMGQVSGLVRLNNYKAAKTTEILKKMGSYVMQKDLIHELLTPREYLTFSAKLKGLPLSRVDVVLKSLDLEKAQNTLIQNVSGGQLKRVAIANELLDPSISVIMLDEPTSGLDSHTAIQTMNILKQMAVRDGKTVICTIHQPSWELASLFDKLLLLSDGRVSYFGGMQESVEFFAKIGYPVPQFANPTDWFLTVSKEVPATTLERLYKTSDLHDRLFGLDEYPYGRHASGSRHVGDDYRAHAHASIRLNSHLRQQGASGVELKTVSSSPSLVQQQQQQPVESIDAVIRQKPGFLGSWLLLMKRSFTASKREPLVVKAKAGQTIVMSLIIGLIFFQLGSDQTAVQSIQGALFFCVVNALFANLQAVVFLFPKEKPIFLRENAAGMVKTLPYFLAKTCADLPFQLFFTLLAQLIYYWLIGFTNTGTAFGTMLGVFQLEGQAAISLGYIISSMAPNVEIGNALVPLFILPMMLFGGLFLNVDNFPVFLAWTSYVSIIKYAFAAVAMSEFGSRTFYCTPGQLVHGVCPITSGDQEIQRLSLQYNITDNCIALLVLAVGLRILAYLVLELVVYKQQSRKVEYVDAIDVAAIDAANEKYVERDDDCSGSSSSDPAVAEIPKSP